ncbi:MAG TPA: outer membrane protein assembly factor BamD [Arenimonas sp.]|uniref:outer membrane protein assembly factor BamD n=1 Tax=Arenimonas sp. TaxID=1872635 RepID=UPI002B586E85|nr:outer membrane protein assembly factor BamD [Arenimonas sp.]HMB56373.1 outer membrane protein assembly factor BamD [Arenimonas sp.]
MIRLSGLPRFFLFLALALSLGGCKTVGGWFGGDGKAETETLPVEALYAQAKQYRDDRNFDQAEKYYTRLVARFPYGPYSEQAQLDLIYVQYKLEKHEDATAGIDRFIRTFPRHPDIDYAYYLKALINFDRDAGFLTRWTGRDTANRDLSGPTQSYNDFNEVLRRFPSSRYAPDSRQRMVYLRNELARYEVNVGLYYYRRGAYVSAANRGKFLVETYPGSEFDGDAVALMAASYTGQGEKLLADDARRVLEKNYPQHPYLTGNWPTKKGVLHKLNPFSGEIGSRK